MVLFTFDYDESSSSYQIQYSSDGDNFTTLGSTYTQSAAIRKGNDNWESIDSGDIF